MITRRSFLLGAGGLVVSACAGGGGSPSGSKVTSLVTSWSTDRFAMGSYSFLKRGSTPADREALAAPVADRIFFAGEATHPDFPATVHGAMLSGYRAADEAMEATDGTIIVIGAGAAGLAAAESLSEEDYDVVVLEGRDRIGGRLWTDTSTFGVPVDLGASWVHGVDGNPILEYDLRTVPFDYDDYEIRGHADHDFEVASELEHEYAADEDELSPEATEEGEELGGGDRLVIGGYQRLADQLRDEAGVDVVLGADVQEISLAASGVDVITTTGTHHGAAVIVTVPLGVLQAGRPRFTPALPPEKAAAIGRLGMGVLSKAILRFDDVFWDDAAMIGLAGQQPRTQWTELVNLAPHTGQPMVMVFSAGRAARALEAGSPQAMAASAEAALRSAYR